MCLVVEFIWSIKLTKVDAEQELERFIETYRRVYRYKQAFIPDHFVAVLKEKDEYVINKNDSTTTIDGFNKELFIKLLVKEELQFETSNMYADVVEMRTDGCTCGSWATSTPEHHSFICRKYVK